MEGEGKLLLSPSLLFPSPSPSFSLFRLRKPILRSIAHVQARCEEAEKTARSWLASQPFFVEAAVSGSASAFQGALIAGSVSYVSGDEFSLPDFSSFFSLKPNKSKPQISPSAPIVQARNFAVMAGLNSCISCTMKRIRGTEDLQGSIVAGFGSGAVFSILSGIGSESRSKQTAFAFSSGLLFAFLQGSLFTLGQAISPEKCFL